jgi:hypothetical protein
MSEGEEEWERRRGRVRDKMSKGKKFQMERERISEREGQL